MKPATDFGKGSRADHFEFSPRDVERGGPGVPHSGDQ
jgi:hypothetical protein